MLHDLRYALRTLRQNPGFAIVAILSMALGIGTSAAMFSSADALVLRPMDLPHAADLVTVRTQQRGGMGRGVLPELVPLSYPDYRDLRDRNKSFEGLAASRYGFFGFAANKGEVAGMQFGELVTGNFFDVLGTAPALGRGFRAEEDQVPGRNPVVVLGYDLWKNTLGSQRDVVGRTVYLDGIAFTVIGVAPESFTGCNRMIRSALFVPQSMTGVLTGETGVWERRGDRELTVMGRLRPGVRLSEAAAEARVIGRQLAETHQDTNRDASLVAVSDFQWRLQQEPLQSALVGIMLALGGLVLLIACANVMNLMLSRARARSREIAVRLAIGAGRGRIIRQLLTESLLIGVVGGALGLEIAQLNVDLFSTFHVPGAVPVQFQMKLDERVLLFTLLVSLASVIVFGLAPALKSTRCDLVPALKSGKAEGGKRRRLFGRNSLVVVQVAASLVLLVFATQAYRGASILYSGPVGFRLDHLFLASFNPSVVRYARPQGEAFYNRLLEDARRLPGVKSAALASSIPMGNTGIGAISIVPEGLTLPPGTTAITVPTLSVTDGYFQTIGIPIVAGREFARTDRADTPRVVVVNEQFAHKYYPNGNAVGRRFRMDGPSGPMLEIVGVAKQSKYFFIAEPPQEWVYVPQSQSPSAQMTLLLETAGPAAEMATPVRNMVHTLDAGQPVFDVTTMQDFFDQRARKAIDILIDQVGGMGLVGLLLALVGLYGLITYSVGLRQREIGIRIAIGADRASVLRMVLRQGLTLAVAGVGIGLVLSWIAGKPTAALVGSAGFHLPLVALVAFALLCAAAVGAFVPARRAASLDPNIVLRQE